MLTYVPGGGVGQPGLSWGKRTQRVKYSNY